MYKFKKQVHMPKIDLTALTVARVVARNASFCCGSHQDRPEVRLQSPVESVAKIYPFLKPGYAMVSVNTSTGLLKDSPSRLRS
jgi:hypothetical protein